MESAEETTHAWPTSHDGYHVYPMIGSGGFSIVHAARRSSDLKECAIKRIHLHRSSFSHAEARNEIRTMRMCHHPNLVSHYANFIYGCELWIVGEYFPFGSLSNINERDEMQEVRTYPFNETATATIIRDLLAGLAYLHNYNLVHCDVKPANILLRGNGESVLGDFGSSRGVGDWNIPIATTPFYRAPEVSRHFRKKLNPKCDVWSVAKTAIDLLEEEDVTRSTKPICDMLKRQYATSFHTFLSRCLMVEPSERSSAMELLDEPWFDSLMDRRVLVKRVLKLVRYRKTPFEEPPIQPPYNFGFGLRSAMYILNWSSCSGEDEGTERAHWEGFDD